MRCVPFTLHKVVNFNHETQECVVEASEENPNMIAQVRNNIIPYTNIEIHEDDEDEDEESDNMRLYREIGIGTYVVNQKIVKEDIINFDISKKFKKDKCLYSYSNEHLHYYTSSKCDKEQSQFDDDNAKEVLYNIDNS